MARMFTLFTPFRLSNSVQVPSLDLSHFTFLYVFIYVSLLKHIFNLTNAFSAGNAFSSSILSSSAD